MKHDYRGRAPFDCPQPRVTIRSVLTSAGVTVCLLTAGAWIALGLLAYVAAVVLGLAG